MDIMTYKLKELRVDLAHAVADAKMVTAPTMLLLKSGEDDKMEEDLRKMRNKLAYQIEDLEYFQKMANRLLEDPNQKDLLEEWSSKIQTQQEVVQSLKKDIWKIEERATKKADIALEDTEEVKGIKK